MTERVAEILGPDGPIARRLEGYEERPEQLEMADAVERALATSGVLLAEAGTGVGKSFAYLLPAVLRACAHRDDGPIVVSTRTIGLQGQLDSKDLPFLHAVLPHEWTSVTAVGRNNYLCLRRMHLAQRDGPALFADAERENELGRIVDWSLTTREGTRMALDPPATAEVWAEVCAEHGNCLHKACKYYDPCHYQRSRRRLDGAQILVVNHALYIADVALRMAGASYLPPHRAVIFDEAHHLEAIATAGLGLRLTRGTLDWHLRRLKPRNDRVGLVDEYGSALARQLCDDLRALGAAFFDHLDERIAGAPDSAMALDRETLEDSLSEPLTGLADELMGCAASIPELDRRTEMQARARGLEALAATVHSLCLPTDADTVRWLERARRGAELHRAPLSVSDALRQFVFDGRRAAVLTSATLGPGADPDFRYLRSKLGIDRADTLRLGSPFDYRRNVRLCVEQALPDPGREPQAYLREARTRVLRHLLDNGGRALVLCTSWAFVRALSEYLEPHLAEADIRLLAQGDAPLAKLLELKKAEPTSVLLGTDSLWEGIDVPGDALTLVIVTRFPFAPPTHPLTKARMRAIEAGGGDAFRDYSLPEAVLKFRQGFGRLVRSGSDRGKVVIVDPRARTRPYGRYFLAALPELDWDEPAP